MKAAVKYYGGKGGMTKEIIKLFPANNTYDIYVEPFGGSASVLLSREKGKVEIYNDIYENVYSLYKVISDKDLFIKFKERCDLLLYPEKIREEFKQLLKSKDLSILDRAIFYFYVNRTSHNGIGGFSINLSSRRGMSKSTSDFLSCIDRLQEMHDRLSSVLILNKDALEVIKKFNQENVFLYLDPPYSWETRTSARYDVDFSPEQQKELVDDLLKIKGKILLSGYINKEYERLEEVGWTRKDLVINTINSKFKPKTKIESFWCNYQ